MDQLIFLSAEGGVLVVNIAWNEEDTRGRAIWYLSQRRWRVPCTLTAGLPGNRAGKRGGSTELVGRPVFFTLKGKRRRHKPRTCGTGRHVYTILVGGKFRGNQEQGTVPE